MLASSGEITVPCPVPLSPTVTIPSSRMPAFSHFGDQADDAPVADPMLHKAGQPFLTDLVEERPDVGVQYPAHLSAIDPDTKRIQRVVRATSGPEPVRDSEEVLLVDRVQQCDHRPLDDLVLQGRDRERALPAVLIRYEQPAATAVPDTLPAGLSRAGPRACAQGPPRSPSTSVDPRPARHSP